MKANSLSMELERGSCFLKNWADGHMTSSLHFKSFLTRITVNFVLKLSSGRRNPFLLLMKLLHLITLRDAAEL